MLQGKDFIILSHAECDSLCRLIGLIPSGVLKGTRMKAAQDHDIGAVAGFDLINQICEVISQEDE